MDKMKGQEEGEEILHSESGIYMKGLFGSRVGKVILTDRRLAFVEERNVTTGGAGGLVGSLAAKAIVHAAGWDKKLKMSVPFAEIERYEQGKQGRNKNIMLLFTKGGEQFKLSLGSDYEGWVERLTPHLK